MTRRGYLSNDKEVCYLLHYDRALDNHRPGRGTLHYIGRTQGDRLDQRMEEHRTGGASKVTSAFHQAGIGFRIAGLFHPVPGQRGFELERRLKARKNAQRFCPICLSEKYHDR